MAETAHLTGRVLERWPVPESGRVEVIDDTTPGLRARISSTGRRTWYYYRSHDGRPVRRAIGDWPEWSASAARAEAERIGAECRGGGPPARERDAERRAGVPLGEVWKGYCEDARARRKARPLENEGYVWRGAWGEWERRPVGTISRQDVAAVHRRIGETRPVLANRAVQLLRRVWRWGVEEGRIEGEHPASGVRMFPEHERTRFVYPEEAEGFLAALRAPETPAHLRDLVELALATGARKGSLLQMEWGDVHADTWYVRGETTKGGRPLVVPLLPLAVAALARRREAVPEGCPYVFPGLGTGQPMADPRCSWDSLRKRAGMSDLTMHDLRRTLGSYMSMGGATLQVIGQALGHRNQRSTAVYAQTQTGPVRDAMAEGLGDLFRAAGEDADAPGAVVDAFRALSPKEREQVLARIAGTEPGPE